MRRCRTIATRLLLLLSECSGLYRNAERYVTALKYTRWSCVFHCRHRHTNVPEWRRCGWARSGRCPTYNKTYTPGPPCYNFAEACRSIISRNNLWIQMNSSSEARRQTNRMRRRRHRSLATATNRPKVQSPATQSTAISTWRIRVTAITCSWKCRPINCGLEHPR